MTTISSRFPTALPNLRAGLAVLLFGVCAVTGASAHDMTDEMLTQRAANCADFAATHTAKATDV